MTPEELLEFSKKQIRDLKVSQDEEFNRLLDFAVERKIITADEKKYLISEENLSEEN